MEKKYIYIQSKRLHNKERTRNIKRNGERQKIYLMDKRAAGD